MPLAVSFLVLVVAVPALTAQAAPLVRVAVGAQHLADTRFKLNPGIGIVAPPGGAARDSLALFLSTAEGATRGWFVRDLSSRDSLPFALLTPLVLRPNIVELSYEEAGLPVDSIAPVQGVYTYRRGVNPRAVAAFVIAILPVVPGFVRAVVTPGGAVADRAFFDRLYSYAWFVTFAISGVAYLVLMAKGEGRRAKGS